MREAIFEQRYNFQVAERRDTFNAVETRLCAEPNIDIGHSLTLFTLKLDSQTIIQTDSDNQIFWRELLLQ